MTCGRKGERDGEQVVIRRELWVREGEGAWGTRSGGVKIEIKIKPGTGRSSFMIGVQKKKKAEEKREIKEPSGRCFASKGAGRGIRTYQRKDHLQESLGRKPLGKRSS